MGEVGETLQYSCHKNPTNSMKRQGGMTQEDESPKLEGVQFYFLGLQNYWEC